MFNNPTDKNTPNPNNNPTPSLFGNATGATQSKPAGGSLFGSSTGGLFGSNTGGGLFSNAASSQLKTTERKQGGLFGNLTSNKPAVSQQAPKLTFGGLPNTNPTAGGLFASNLDVKKSEAPSSGLFSNKPEGSSLFSGSTFGGPSGGLLGNPTQPANPPTTGGLFGNVSQPINVPSGGLFGNIKKPEQKPKQTTPQQPSFLQSSGLFSTTTQQKKQEKPTSTLFGGTLSGLFGTTPQTTTPTTGGLFSGGEKKQGGLFPSSAAESALFSKPNQPLASTSLFGGVTKKQEQKKPAQGGLFGSSTTPAPSLFNQPSKGPKQSTEAPKFSLTGNIASGNTPSFGSGGLFGQPQKAEEQKPKPQVTQKQAEIQKPVVSGGLFGAVTPTIKPVQQTTSKPSVSSLFGSGNQGLFSNQQKKPQPNKPAQTPSGLFSLNGKQKKQVPPATTPTPLGGSLFGQKKQQTPKQQAKPSGGLFEGSSSLFGKTPQPKVDKPQGTSLFENVSKTAEKKQQAKTSQPLTATFSKPTETGQKPSLFGIKKDQTQPQKSRTISFNEPQEKEIKRDENKKKQPKQLSGGNYVPFSTDDKKQQQTTNLTQTITSKQTKLNETQPQKQVPLVTTQPPKPSSSFFSQPVNLAKPSQPQQKIITSLQIANILQSNERQLKKQQLKQIQQWIGLSFTRSNQIVTSQMLTKQFVLHKNEDINRFLNDLFREVVMMVNLPYEEKSFKLMNKLFDQLLDSLNIKEFLFKCTKVNVTKPGAITTTEVLQIVQLNNAYFTHHMIYRFTAQTIYLNLESQQVQKYLLALTKKFISNHIEYLQFLQRKTEILQLPYILFYTLLKYCLSYNKLRMKTLPTTRQHLTQIISLVQDFEKKIITKISALLQVFANDNFASFQMINKQYLPELIKLLDYFSYTQEDTLIRTALKVILNTIDLPNITPQSSINAQLKTTIKQTRSLQLLPIRTLVTCYQPNSASTLSMISAHDLYHYISGPEWIDWLQLYLSSGMNSNLMMERQISAIQAKYMLNILAYPKLKKKRITRQKMSLKQTRYIQQLQKKILPKKRPISKFIHTLKQQNMLDIFYLILESLIYDYESYRRITQTFFRQKDEFIYEFKVIVAEVCNYPLQQFKEEIPFLQQKMSYFLRICEVAPQKIIEIQKMVFDGIRIDERSRKSKQQIVQFGTWDVGHRICHLVIDTMNYFGMKQNQKIVAKSIACIRELISHQYTSSAMKLAMAVNKPQMNFIINTSSLPLSQKLTVQMMDLLQYFLVSDEFVNMLMVNLRSNNSQQVQLERYYAVRYSVKDYKVLLNQVAINQHKQPVFEQQSTITLGYSHKQKLSIQIIPSSYWFLRLLQTMVRSFKQQKMSHQLQKQLLYLVNLMLERLIVPVMEGDHQLLLTSEKEGSKQTYMVEQHKSLINTHKPSMTPIYPLSNQSQQLSRVLSYIIQALNSMDIFSLIKQKLTYSVTRASQHPTSSSSKSSPVYYIQNNLLFNDYQQQQLSVYLSVNLLKNIVSLYRHFEKIRNTKSTLSLRKVDNSNRQVLKSVNAGENKMMYKLLSKMRWLQQLQQQVFVKTLSTLTTTTTSLLSKQIANSLYSNNDIVVGLITLLTINSNYQQQQNQPISITTVQQSAPMNLKLSYQKPLVVPILDGQQTKRKSYSANMNKIQKFYSLYREQMNYQQVHDFMTVTHNRYLQSFQSIQTIVITTLRLLVQPNQSDISSYKLNLIKHLTLPYESSLSSTTWLLQLLSKQLLSFLESTQSSIQLKQSILLMLNSMISSSQSTGGFIFAKKVFYKFIKLYQVYNKSLGPYHLQHRNRMNLIILHTVNILFDKDHYNFTTILSVDFIDQLLSFIINNCQQIISSSQSIIKSLKSFNNKYLYPQQMTYYQLETSCEERELVSVSDALHTLRQAIMIVEKLFFDQQIRRYNQDKKIKYTSIKRLTSVLIRTGLPYLPVDIWANNLSTLSLDNFTTLSKKTSINYIPRVFTNNPLLHYITQSSSVQSISDSFKLYKENILNYVSQKSIRLAQSSLRFLTWSLTIDNTLYGNQPIKKLQLLLSKMSCASHMGSYQMTAIQMFGQNEIQAVCRVKELYQLSLHTLSAMCSNNKVRGYCFVQTITVMGYCIQWLRARRDTDDTLSVLIRSTLSSSRVWLQPNTLSHPNVIKLVHSLSSIASSLKVNPSVLGQIKLLITQLVSKYMQNRTIFVNESIIHQLLIILVNFPISIEDSETISHVTTLWQNETNSQYFYNLSRLMIEYGINVPGQLARLKVLTKCQKVNQLFNSQNNQIIPQCYHYGMRSPQSISITWIFKLASTMMSSTQQSVLLLQQISEFYTMASKYIQNLLKNIPTTGNISFVYLQLLQAITEFLLTLVSSSGWVSVYRAQFEKVTFLLSHKLINVIMDCVGGKLLVVPQSEMQRRLRKQSSLMTGNSISTPQLDTTSTFKLFSDYHIFSLLNLYTRLLSQSLYNSYYVNKYFNTTVYENYRYGVSYWDRMNKSIGDMLKYGVTMRRRYQKLSQGKTFINKLIALSDFTNCSQYFVETGYLVSLTSIPQSPSLFISLIDQMISTIIQLGNVHLIQQSTFRQRYQCIMKGNIQKFGNKLIDNVKMLQKIYDDDQKNYSSSSMSTQKHQTNNYPQYYQQVGKNLHILVKNV